MLPCRATFPTKQIKKGNNPRYANSVFQLSAARVAVIGAVVAIALGLAACGSSSDSSSTSSSGDTTGATSSGSGPNAGTTLNLVGYSTPQSVYEDALEPGFQKTKDGAGVDFSDSFGPSGDQSRAVEAGGQPADVVHFSIQPDMQRLVDDGIVDKSWTPEPVPRVRSGLGGGDVRGPQGEPEEHPQLG